MRQICSRAISAFDGCTRTISCTFPMCSSRNSTLLPRLAIRIPASRRYYARPLKFFSKIFADTRLVRVRGESGEPGIVALLNRDRQSGHDLGGI